MEIHTAHAEPIGEFIHDGRHKPFRALACQVGLSSQPRISREPIHPADLLKAGEADAADDAIAAAAETDEE